MTVTAATSSSSGSSAASRSSTKTLAGNFDTFLKLLTTQLRQQDPLQPMDASAFTSQLVQFATVEQAIQTNTKLEDLTKLTRAGGTAAATGLLGQDVTATTSELALGADGDATIRYSLPKQAAEVQISILDAGGRVVQTAAGATAAGDQTVTWNGLGPDGQRLAAGTYTVKITAKDADGAELAAEQLVSGRVQRIEPGDGDVQLVVGGVAVPLAAVRDVRPPAAA
jgi:flagellar basal-body rod modification protein FlgD